MSKISKHVQYLQLYNCTYTYGIQTDIERKLDFQVAKAIRTLSNSLCTGPLNATLFYGSIASFVNYFEAHTANNQQAFSTSSLVEFAAYLLNRETCSRQSFQEKSL